VVCAARAAAARCGAGRTADKDPDRRFLFRSLRCARSSRHHVVFGPCPPCDVRVTWRVLRVHKARLSIWA
jgi:hypothetical protein